MKILFQGDSITDGNRYKDEASRWDLNHQIGHSYAYMVTGQLTAEWPHRFECVNRGVSGNTVRHLKERWQKDALEIRPDVLILLVGVNDCSHIAAGTMTAQEYGSIYRELLREVREVSPAVRFILLEPFLLRDDPSAMKILDGLRAEVHKISAEENALFVPLQEEFLKRAETDGASLWLWDGVHPTEAGHWLIARKIMKLGAETFGIQADGKVGERRT